MNVAPAVVLEWFVTFRHAAYSGVLVIPCGGADCCSVAPETATAFYAGRTRHDPLTDHGAFKLGKDPHHLEHRRAAGG